MVSEACRMARRRKTPCQNLAHALLLCVGLTMVTYGVYTEFLGRLLGPCPFITAHWPHPWNKPTMEEFAIGKADYHTIDLSISSASHRLEIFRQNSRPSWPCEPLPVTSSFARYKNFHVEFTVATFVHHEMHCEPFRHHSEVVARVALNSHAIGPPSTPRPTSATSDFRIGVDHDEYRSFPTLEQDS